MELKLRVLIAKPGLDGHDIGAKVIVRALRDAGMEVIYTGLRQTPEQVAQAAVQEDVDLVGISILSGAHLELARLTLAALDRLGGSDIPLVVGGTVPPQDVPVLMQMGVKSVFVTGSTLVECVQEMARLGATEREAKSRGTI